MRNPGCEAEYGKPRPLRYVDVRLGTSQEIQSIVNLGKLPSPEIHEPGHEGDPRFPVWWLRVDNWLFVRCILQEDLDLMDCTQVTIVLAELTYWLLMSMNPNAHSVGLLSLLSHSGYFQTPSLTSHATTVQSIQPEYPRHVTAGILSGELTGG